MSRILKREAQQNVVWLSHNKIRTASHRAVHLGLSADLDLFLSLGLPSSAPLPCLSELVMAIPGPYSGVSTLAFVARASAFTFGAVYGTIKLSYLREGS
ncbi:ATP synthase E chain [Musa troglodytarum]|uniref:ATP synthase E chain n=1 Tax=Musa troglodytarum TaxID=320322 RepID=A0A9E7HGC5_9LILI|nr:ATP synthase E chain [Musa troglodytarum]